MKIFITGATGFVGGYLIASLQQEFGTRAQIVLTSKRGGVTTSGLPVEVLDVSDADSVMAAIRSHAPTHVVHLAGIAAIPAAAARANLAWQIHLFGTLNLAQAILAEAPECMLVFVSSGQVYGATARLGHALAEHALLAPINEYALTKAAADLALGTMAQQGLRCVRMRPFNHTGPGQSEDFVVPSFAMQIARIEAGLQRPEIHVGNLTAKRDFLDVRDVTAAYCRVIARSSELEAGAIFNIASGVPRCVDDILSQLVSMSDAKISVVQDMSRMRAVDTPGFVGNAKKARDLLGWTPQRSFESTLTEILAYSRANISINTTDGFK